MSYIVLGGIITSMFIGVVFVYKRIQSHYRILQNDQVDSSNTEESYMHLTTPTVSDQDQSDVDGVHL